METFILAFILIALVIIGMAVGVIFSNKPIKGSCGGVGKFGIKSDCDVCGRADECERANKTDEQ